MEEPPEGSLPLKWNKTYKVVNQDLRSVETVLKDEIIGAETVAVAPDGRLGLVDKDGKVGIGVAAAQATFS